MYFDISAPNYGRKENYNEDYYPMQVPTLSKKDEKTQTDSSNSKTQNKTNSQTQTNYGITAIINQKLAEQKALLEQRYNQSIANIDKAYNTSKNQLDKNKNDELQQQYINNQLLMKKMPEQLAQMGANGGMSETSLIQGKSNYENNRNKTVQFFEDKLSQLMVNRDKEKVNAGMGHSENLAKLQAEYYKDVIGSITSLAKQSSTSSSQTKTDTSITKNPYYTYIAKSIENGLSMNEAAAKARENNASEEIVNEILDYLLNIK